MSRLVVRAARVFSVLTVAVAVGLPAADAASNHGKAPSWRTHPQAAKPGVKGKTVQVKLGGKGAGAADPGDDYPASLKNRPQDSVFDQWRMYNRECVSFVAWALASRNGFNIPFFANAADWPAKARAKGFRVDTTPGLGSVAYMGASRSYPLGHVAWVQDVSGGSVRVAEYNFSVRGGYSTRTVPASTFTGYIHFKDIPEDPTPAPQPQPQPQPTPVPVATPTPKPTSTPTPTPTSGGGTVINPTPAPPAPTPTPVPAPPKPSATNLQVVVYGGGHVGVAFNVGWQAGRDPVTCHFFRDNIEVFTAGCGTSSSKQFYGVPAGTHSFYATVSDAFGVYSDPTETIVKQTS